MISDPFLAQTLQLAESAVSKSNHPFGAVLVHEGKVIAIAENTVVTDHDVTAHAELNLVRKVSREFPGRDLSSHILYASTEPCAMCSGAIYWAGVGSVVFGCSNKTLAEIVGGTLEISSREIFARGTNPISVTGPVQEDEFRKVHEIFWR